MSLFLSEKNLVFYLEYPFSYQLSHLSGLGMLKKWSQLIDTKSFLWYNNTNKK